MLHCLELSHTLMYFYLYHVSDLIVLLLQYLAFGSPSTSSTTKTALGTSFGKLSSPVDQLLIKYKVLTDKTILYGLSENKIVLSDVILNSKVYVIALIFDTEPNYAC